MREHVRVVITSKAKKRSGAFDVRFGASVPKATPKLRPWANLDVLCIRSCGGNFRTTIVFYVNRIELRVILTFNICGPIFV